METKTVKGRGPTFVQKTIANHQIQGWEVLSMERGTLGSIIIVFTRADAAAPATPPRPD